MSITKGGFVSRNALRVMRFIIRWHVRNYMFESVIKAFWLEFREFYNEDNIPSSKATISEVIDDIVNDRGGYR